MTSFYLGNFLGSTGGGLMVDQIGFRWSIVVIFCANLIMALLDLADLFIELKRKVNDVVVVLLF